MEDSSATNIIEEFVHAGSYLKDYKKFKHLSMKDAETFKNTFTIHRNRNPPKYIDIDEEINTLKRKFDELNYGLDYRKNTEMQLLKPKKQFPDDNIKRIPQIRKIFCPRWLSKMVAEFDIDSSDPHWELSECKTNLDFLPFCSFVYLPNYHILSIGGLNNKINHENRFSSRVVKILIENLNLEKMDKFVYYQCREMQPMKIQRGLMGSVYVNNYVYVAGGMTQK